MAQPKALYYTILNYSSGSLSVLGDHFDLIQLPDPSADTKEVLANLDLCFAPLGYRFDGAKMARCPKLQAIVTNTTGLPYIDMGAAAARGIQVFSLKDEQAFLQTITATAEHTSGLLLALLRRTPWSFQAVLSGKWNRFEFSAPAMLSRLSLGIVGLGRLGTMVGRYGAAFGMQVRYYDPYVKAHIRTLNPPFGDGTAYKRILEVLATVDLNDKLLNKRICALNCASLSDFAMAARMQIAPVRLAVVSPKQSTFFVTSRPTSCSLSVIGVRCWQPALQRTTCASQLHTFRAVISRAVWMSRFATR